MTTEELKMPSDVTHVPSQATPKKDSFATVGVTDHSSSVSDEEDKEELPPSKVKEEEVTPETTTMSDEDLISAANVEIHEECLLAASRLLHQVKDQTMLTDQHHQVLQVAQDMKESSDDLLYDPDDTWTKQSEVKESDPGKKKKQRDTAIYYKVNDNRLESRIDCVMETSLLVPLLSVLNETDLYITWIPSWTVPVTIGIKESKQLKQVSRAQQIIHITANVPWPISTRDLILRATAADDIASHHAIIVRMKTVHVGEDPVVPPPAKGVVRCDFEGAILIRPCPKSKLPKQQNDGNAESKVMVSLKMFVDPHLSVMPTSIINFVTRTVIGTMWSMLLHVAEGVRDGKRPLHAEAIDKRQDLYDWIRARIQVLLGNMEKHKSVSALSLATGTLEESVNHHPVGGDNQGLVGLVPS